MPHQGKVYLGLVGHGFDPEQLSIGVAPTKVMVEDSPRPKHSAWMYGTASLTAELLDVSSMASQVVEALLPHEAALLAAKKAYDLDVVLQVVLTFSEREEDPMPIIGFSPAVVSFLHRLGGDIDIDTYRAAS